MKRSCFRRGPFGLRVTPDDIRDCFSFLRSATLLVQKGCPDRVGMPWAPWRIVGIPAAAFRRRP